MASDVKRKKREDVSDSDTEKDESIDKKEKILYWVGLRSMKYTFVLLLVGTVTSEGTCFERDSCDNGNDLNSESGTEKIDSDSMEVKDPTSIDDSCILVKSEETTKKPLANGADIDEQDESVTLVSPLPPKLKDFESFKTLTDFGYGFDSKGQLRNLVDNEPFVFDVFKDKQKNQKRYEALGEIITTHVYGLLESASLRRLPVPADAGPDEATGFVFASPDLDDNPNLLVLIHGSGVVRAGQWARRLIINDCLDSGTQLPFIQRGRDLGLSTLVLNTNQTDVIVDGRATKIRGSETPIDHGHHVFQNIILKRPNIKNVFIVAHSFGGAVTVRLASAFPSKWQSLVRAVAFTDSVHSCHGIKQTLRRWFTDNAINWVASDDELDLPQRSFGSVVPCVSAGHPKHENTSWSACDSIFRFFKKKLDMVEEAEGN